jgi:hypothetical protein
MAGGLGAGGGYGGAPPSPVVCPVSASAVDVSLLGSDGQLVTTSFESHVVVTAVGRCAEVGCTPPSLPDGGLGSVAADDLRIVFEDSSGAPLTLYWKIPQMPPDALKVGDDFDLAVSAGIDPFFVTTVNQTVTLVRGGRLIAFATQLRNFGVPSLPSLDRVGLALEAGDVVCKSSSICDLRRHSVRVTTAAGVSAVVQPGQTVTLGDHLSFTSDSYDEYVENGRCDAKSVTRMAGFAGSACSGT